MLFIEWFYFCGGPARTVLFSPDAATTWTGMAGDLQEVTPSTQACANFAQRAQYISDNQGPISEDILKPEEENVFTLRSRSIQAYGWMGADPEHGAAFHVSHMVQMLWPATSALDVERAITYRDQSRKCKPRYRK